jgi:hypothetical protein
VRAADLPSGGSVQRSGGHAGPMIERLPLSKEGGRAVRGWDLSAARRWYPLTTAHPGGLRDFPVLWSTPRHFFSVGY